MPYSAETVADVAGAAALALGFDAPASPIFGNRCGHDPAELREHVPRPKRRILRKLAERVTDFFQRPYTIPTLERRIGTPDRRAEDRGRVPDRRKASDRRMRSERREGCILLLQAMLYHCDIVSLRVGRPVGDDMPGLSLARLAQRAGLTLRRTERALCDLIRAGIVTSHRQHERGEDGTVRARPARRTLSRAIFETFGLSRELAKDRKSESRRRKAPRAPEPGTRAHGRNALVMDAIKRKLGLGTKDPP